MPELDRHIDRMMAAKDWALQQPQLRRAWPLALVSDAELVQLRSTLQVTVALKDQQLLGTADQSMHIVLAGVVRSHSREHKSDAVRGDLLPELPHVPTTAADGFAVGTWELLGIEGSAEVSAISVDNSVLLSLRREQWDNIASPATLVRVNSVSDIALQLQAATCKRLWPLALVSNMSAAAALQRAMQPTGAAANSEVDNASFALVAAGALLSAEGRADGSVVLHRAEHGTVLHGDALCSKHQLSSMPVWPMVATSASSDQASLQVSWVNSMAESHTVFFALTHQRMDEVLGFSAAATARSEIAALLKAVRRTISRHRMAQLDVVRAELADIVVDSLVPVELETVGNGSTQQTLAIEDGRLYVLVHGSATIKQNPLDVGESVSVDAAHDSSTTIAFGSGRRFEGSKLRAQSVLIDTSEPCVLFSCALDQIARSVAAHTDQRERQLHAMVAARNARDTASAERQKAVEARLNVERSFEWHTDHNEHKLWTRAVRVKHRLALLHGATLELTAEESWETKLADEISESLPSVDDIAVVFRASVEKAGIDSEAVQALERALQLAESRRRDRVEEAFATSWGVQLKKLSNDSRDRDARHLAELIAVKCLEAEGFQDDLSSALADSDLSWTLEEAHRLRHEKRLHADRVQASIIFRWKRRELAGAFNAWLLLLDAAQSKRRKEMVSKRALRRWLHGQLARVFNKWMEQVMEARRRQQVLRRAQGKWMHGTLGAAWAAWADLVQESRRNRVILERSAVRWKKLTLSQAFVAWFDQWQITA